MKIIIKLINWLSPQKKINYKNQLKEVEGWMWVREDGVWDRSLDNSRIYYNRPNPSLGFNRDRGYHLNKVKVKIYPVESIEEK